MKRALCASAGGLLMALSAALQANPTAPVVASGTATFAASGATLSLAVP